ncbi:MAG: transposase [Bdellovibrionaceae bacterium]|nr:transposase [Pseudobdellovibrionaceae bacterium]
MGKRGKRYTSEQIITKLREAEVLQSQGASQARICKQLGVAVDTYIRWRKEYGGMRVDQAKRLKDLEKENQRLKKLVADLALDKAMLEEVNKGNF